jgi:Xaa-Pro dipeptidase
MPAFSATEYRERIARVKRRMERAGIDVLLCAEPASLNYLCGYDGWSFYVHQFLVLSLTMEEPLWVGREMDAAGARLTTVLKPESLAPYPEDHVDSPERHPARFVAELMKQRGYGRARIGLELDAFYFTGRSFAELGKALPDARLIDVYPLVNWVRIVKSPAEIAMMRGAAAIVSHAMEVGIAAIKPGVRECDAVAEICAAQLHGTGAYWGDYPSALPNVPSGAKTAAPHLTWSGDRYAPNSVAYLELGGCHHRYHAALARTLYLGKPPAQVFDLAKVVSEGLDTALDAARAGRTCHEVEAAWRAVIERAGHAKSSRIGYSIGLNYPPDWGERTASLRQGDHTILEPDMCFHMILGMWMADWGFELSETFRVTADGAPEVLTSFPRELVVKA